MIGRKPGESAADFRARVLDPVSPSFCAAKWLNATVWLGSGQTASCHHPLPHTIARDAVAANFRALHNTPHKKNMRAEMLAGRRPPECEYCWKIEDMPGGAVSDRVHKSDIYKPEHLEEIRRAGAAGDITPRTLEIAFDRRCNLACSYCNAGYSTRWAGDIAKHGPYQNLRSDGGGAYRHAGAWAEAFAADAENPFFEAFLKWWPELKETLLELRLTGGEPLYSPDFWKFLDRVAEAGCHPELLFSINSNLSLSDAAVERLIDKTRGIRRLGLYTSCEAQGPQAEYIRDGLDYALFSRNLKRVLDSGRFERVVIMSTIGALSLFSLTRFLDEMLELKAKHGTYLPTLSLTILRFPSFMSPSVLPEGIRRERAEHLRSWLETHRSSGLLWTAEIEDLERLIGYLTEVDIPHHRASSLDERRGDFRSFFDQYDRRRGKNLTAVFPPELAAWYGSLPVSADGARAELIDGNASEGFHGT